jgi:hypothetical protein
MTEKNELAQALREPPITQEMIDAMPEGDRPIWQQLLDAKAQKDQLVTDRMEDADYDGALVLLGSEERAGTLIDCASRLPVEEARKLVAKWWSVTEAWSGNPELREGMHEMIRRVAPVEALAEENPRPWPSGMVTIFRGNNGEEPHGCGSWTMDYDVAVKFAAGTKSLRGMFLGIYDEDGIPSIWRAYVPAGRILGYFDDRSEQEVVVNTDDCIDITLVAQAEEQ